MKLQKFTIGMAAAMLLMQCSTYKPAVRDIQPREKRTLTERDLFKNGAAIAELEIAKMLNSDMADYPWMAESMVLILPVSTRSAAS